MHLGERKNPLLYVLFTMQKGFKPGQGWFETAEKLMKIGCFRDFFSSFGISCPVQPDNMGIRQYFNKVKENTVKKFFSQGKFVPALRFAGASRMEELYGIHDIQ